jgi:hypothetical protein
MYKVPSLLAQAVIHKISCIRLWESYIIHPCLGLARLLFYGKTPSQKGPECMRRCPWLPSLDRFSTIFILGARASSSFPAGIRPLAALQCCMGNAPGGIRPKAEQNHACGVGSSLALAWIFETYVCFRGKTYVLFIKYGLGNGITRRQMTVSTHLHFGTNGVARHLGM